MVRLVVEFEQLGPNGLAAIGGVFIETATVVPTTTTELSDHGFNDFAEHFLLAKVVQHAHLRPGLGCLAVEFKTHLIMHGQRADGHSNGFAEVVDEHRMSALV
ncbi:hypothetical protein D9M71_834490 [compost metagenome]